MEDTLLCARNESALPWVIYTLPTNFHQNSHYTIFQKKNQNRWFDNIISSPPFVNSRPGYVPSEATIRFTMFTN